LINESAFDNEVSKELKGTLKMLYEKAISISLK